MMTRAASRNNRSTNKETKAVGIYARRALYVLTWIARRELLAMVFNLLDKRLTKKKDII